MNNTTRKIDLIPDDEFKEFIGKATSCSNLLATLGLGISSTTIGHTKQRIKRLGLDCSHFVAANGRGNRRDSDWKMELDESLKVRASTTTLRKNLLGLGHIYICVGCGNDGTWGEKQLTLEIHHKNSNWRDNRPENLEFLCPNCHSQHTRNNKPLGNIPRFGNCKCGKQLLSDKTDYCSLTCYGETRTVRDWSSIDLVKMVDEDGMNIFTVSKMLDVKFNTINKWYKRQKESTLPT